MADFYVDIKGMYSSVNDEQTLVREIGEIYSQLNGILAGLSISSAQITRIKNRLDAAMNNVNDRKAQLAAFAVSLNEITALYESTENKLCGKSGISPEYFAGVSNAVANGIEKAAEYLGMEPFAKFSKDPVNLSNGNYVYEKECLSMNNGMNMDLSIFYNVQNKNSKSMGRGWAHSFNVCLIIKEDRVELERFNGMRDVFESQDGVFTKSCGLSYSVAKCESGYVLIDSDNDSLYFDGNGKLIRRESLGGRLCTIYEYNEDGTISNVSDWTGDYLHFSYDNGKLCCVEDHSGRKVSFAYDGDLLVEYVNSLGESTLYSYDDGSRLCRIENSAGVYCLKNEFDEYGRTIFQQFPDGGEVKYRYDDSNALVEMEEQNGNRIKYYHDSNFRNVRTEYSDGFEESKYDNQNNRTKFTNKRGYSFKYEYTPQGSVKRVENPLGDVIEYDYNDMNQILSYSMNGTVLQRLKYNDRNLLEHIVDSCGSKEEYLYNDDGLLLAHVAPDGSKIQLEYDNCGNISTYTNATGGITKYEYNGRHQVIKSTDPIGNVETYRYDDENRIIESKDANGNIKSFSYDSCGNLVEVIDYNGARTYATYNNINKVDTITDSEGNVTKYEYDKMWNISEVTYPDGSKELYEYDLNGHLIKHTDRCGFVNEMEYDSCGNMIKRKDPTGAIWEIGYDALNRADYVKDAVGTEYRATYDGVGNVTEVSYSEGSSKSYTYDLCGRLLSSTEEDGYTKYYTYDDMGNMTEVRDDTGWLLHCEYYPGGLLKRESVVNGEEKSYKYNQNEKITEVTDESGCITSIEYDAKGNISKVSKSTGESEVYSYDGMGNIISFTDGMGNVTKYDYSSSGLLTKVTDAVGNKTEYAYDYMHNLVKIDRGNERVTTYVRDENGNIISVISPDNSVINMAYDRCNRLISKELQNGTIQKYEYYPDGAPKSYSFGDEKTVKYSYDALKRLSEVEDWIGKTSIQRDKAGRVIEVSQPNGDVVKYEWNQRGKRERIVYPNGETISYKYNESSQLCTLMSGDKQIDYLYGDNGLLKKKICSDGSSVSIAYNGNKISDVIYSIDNEEIRRDSVLYDAIGRKSLLARSDRDNTDIRIAYKYSPIGSLTGVEKNGVLAEEYEYDIWGNRVSSCVNGCKRLYEYDSMDRLVNVREESGKKRTYRYDICGNLASEMVDGVEERKTTFNTLGFLEEILYKGNRTKYEYNGFGYRVGSCTTDEYGTCMDKNEYVYDITKDYNNLLCVHGKEKTINLLWDNKTANIVDTKDYILKSNDGLMDFQNLYGMNNDSKGGFYDSFGWYSDCLNNEDEIFGFAGYRKEKYTGLLYVNAREYDPSIGRFISRDSLEGQADNPLTLNKYAYCNSDPINYFDPLGFFLGWIVGGIKAAANVVTKVAGDIVNTTVNSIKNGEFTPSFSPWQEYVGTATGGFVEGVTFVATRGNMGAASAAGSATETFVTNGLSMISGREGYRAEDGYTVGNLLYDTALSGTTGLIEGYTAGKLFKDPGIKIDGITKGSGSYLHVAKIQLTKIANGTTKHLSLKTIGKMATVFVGVSGLETLKDKFVDAGKEYLEDKAKSFIEEQVKNVFGDNDMRGFCPIEVTM